MLYIIYYYYYWCMHMHVCEEIKHEFVVLHHSLIQHMTHKFMS